MGTEQSKKTKSGQRNTADQHDPDNSMSYDEKTEGTSVDVSGDPESGTEVEEAHSVEETSTLTDSRMTGLPGEVVPVVLRNASPINDQTLSIEINDDQTKHTKDSVYSAFPQEQNNNTYSGQTFSGTTVHTPHLSSSSCGTTVHIPHLSSSCLAGTAESTEHSNTGGASHGLDISKADTSEHCVKQLVEAHKTLPVKFDDTGQFKKKVTEDFNDNRITYKIEESEDLQKVIHHIPPLLSNVMFLPDKSKGASPKRYGPKRLGSREMASLPDIADSSSEETEGEVDLDLEGPPDGTQYFHDPMAERSDSMTALVGESLNDDTGQIEQSIVAYPAQNANLSAIQQAPKEELEFVEDHFGLYTGCVASGVSSNFQLDIQSPVSPDGPQEIQYQHSMNVPQQIPHANASIESQTRQVPANENTEEKLKDIKNTVGPTKDIVNQSCNTVSVIGKDSDMKMKEKKIRKRKKTKKKKQSKEIPNNKPIEMIEELQDFCDKCHETKDMCGCITFSNDPKVMTAVQNTRSLPVPACVRFRKICDKEIPWSDFKSHQGQFAAKLKSVKTPIFEDNRLRVEFNLPLSKRPDECKSQNFLLKDTVPEIQADKESMETLWNKTTTEITSLSESFSNRNIMMNDFDSSSDNEDDAKRTNNNEFNDEEPTEHYSDHETSVFQMDSDEEDLTCINRNCRDNQDQPPPSSNDQENQTGGSDNKICCNRNSSEFETEYSSSHRCKKYCHHYNNPCYNINKVMYDKEYMPREEPKASVNIEHGLQINDRRLINDTHNSVSLSFENGYSSDQVDSDLIDGRNCNELCDNIEHDEKTPVDSESVQWPENIVGSVESGKMAISSDGKINIGPLDDKSDHEHAYGETQETLDTIQRDGTGALDNNANSAMAGHSNESVHNETDSNDECHVIGDLDNKTNKPLNTCKDNSDTLKRRHTRKEDDNRYNNFKEENSCSESSQDKIKLKNFSNVAVIKTYRKPSEIVVSDNRMRTVTTNNEAGDFNTQNNSSNTIEIDQCQFSTVDVRVMGLGAALGDTFCNSRSCGCSSKSDDIGPFNIDKLDIMVPANEPLTNDNDKLSAIVDKNLKISVQKDESLKEKPNVKGKSKLNTCEGCDIVTDNKLNTCEGCDIVTDNKLNTCEGCDIVTDNKLNTCDTVTDNKLNSECKKELTTTETCSHTDDNTFHVRGTEVHWETDDSSYESDSNASLHSLDNVELNHMEKASVSETIGLLEGAVSDKEGNEYSGGTESQPQGAVSDKHQEQGDGNEHNSGRDSQPLEDVIEDQSRNNVQQSYESESILVNVAEPESILGNEAEPESILVNVAEPESILVNVAEPESFLGNKADLSDDESMSDAGVKKQCDEDNFKENGTFYSKNSETAENTNMYVWMKTKVTKLNDDNRIVILNEEAEDQKLTLKENYNETIKDTNDNDEEETVSKDVANGSMTDAGQQMDGAKISVSEQGEETINIENSVSSSQSSAVDENPFDLSGLLGDVGGLTSSSYQQIMQNLLHGMQGSERSGLGFPFQSRRIPEIPEAATSEFALSLYQSAQQGLDLPTETENSSRRDSIISSSSNTSVASIQNLVESIDVQGEPVIENEGMLSTDQTSSVVQNSSENSGSNGEPHLTSEDSVKGLEGLEGAACEDEKAETINGGKMEDTTDESQQAPDVLPGKASTKKDQNIWPPFMQKQLLICKKVKDLPHSCRGTVLCVDASDNMKGLPWKQTISHIVNFLVYLEKIQKEHGIDEYVALVVFGKETVVKVHLTNDYYHLKMAIERTRPGGPCNMLPGIALALYCLYPFQGRRYAQAHDVIMENRVILFSTGSPVHWQYEPPTLEPNVPSKVTHSNSTQDHDDTLITSTTSNHGDAPRLTPQQQECTAIQEIESSVHEWSKLFDDVKSQMHCVPVGENPNMVCFEALKSAIKAKIQVDQVQQLARSTHNHYVTAQISNQMFRASEEFDVVMFKSLLQTLYPDRTQQDVIEIVNIAEEAHAEYVVRKNEPQNDSADWRLGKKGLPPFGSRVTPGPDMDEAVREFVSEKGTITQHLMTDEGKVFVQWDNGYEGLCAMGHNNKYAVIPDEDSMACSVEDKIKVGYTVRRGPDWKFENQDGGGDQVGKVIAICRNDSVLVRWSNGNVGNYRCAVGGVYDVVISDPTDPLGIDTFTKEMNKCNKDNSLNSQC